MAGDSRQAMLILTECLALAEPDGYVRVFLDEGRPVQQLLSQWLAHADSNPLRDYAIQLLDQFGAGQHVPAARQKMSSPAGDPSAGSGQTRVEPKFRPVLVETLSRREMEVLELIALGRTNQEIARQLIVSPGTVKAHTASIYRKLDVANRTEAVGRARQLGILP
jgi:LuxR family maltose regulon positive regulatory protein